jgi:hypothetical protein
MVKPSITPMTNGGLTTPFTLYIDESSITSSPATNTSFIVRLNAASNPTSALKFRIDFT